MTWESEIPKVENKFKSVKGSWLTQSLFLELAKYTGRLDSALFSLKDFDREFNGTKYPSLKKLFLEDLDPTNYSFATEHLGGWPHYLQLLKSNKLRPILDEWQEEKEILLMSKGMKQIITQTGNGNYQAAKWLADKGWVERRGRPSTAEKAKKLKQQNLAKTKVAADLERLRMN